MGVCHSSTRKPDDGEEGEEGPSAGKLARLISLKPRRAKSYQENPSAYQMPTGSVHRKISLSLLRVPGTKEDEAEYLSFQRSIRSMALHHHDKNRWTHFWLRQVEAPEALLGARMPGKEMGNLSPISRDVLSIIMDYAFLRDDAVITGIRVGDCFARIYRQPYTHQAPALENTVWVPREVSLFTAHWKVDEVWVGTHSNPADDLLYSLGNLSFIALEFSEPTVKKRRGAKSRQSEARRHSGARENFKR